MVNVSCLQDQKYSKYRSNVINIWFLFRIFTSKWLNSAWKFFDSTTSGAVHLFVRKHWVQCTPRLMRMRTISSRYVNETASSICTRGMYRCKGRHSHGRLHYHSETCFLESAEVIILDLDEQIWCQDTKRRKTAQRMECSENVSVIVHIILCTDPFEFAVDYYTQIFTTIESTNHQFWSYVHFWMEDCVT